MCTLVLAGCGGAARVVARDDADPWRPPSPEPVQLELETLDGNGVELATLRGRPVLVNYFATWCVPCINELPRLNDLVPEEGETPGDLQIVGVSLDRGGRSDLEAFVKATQLRFAIALADEATLRGETPFGALPAVPASYLLDAEGRTVERFRGVVPIGYLKRRVAALAVTRGDDVRAD